MEPHLVQLQVPLDELGRQDEETQPVGQLPWQMGLTCFFHRNGEYIHKSYIWIYVICRIRFMNSVYYAHYIGLCVSMIIILYDICTAYDI